MLPEKNLSSPSLEKVNSPDIAPPAGPEPKKKSNRFVRWLLSKIKSFWEALCFPWYNVTLALVLVGLTLVYQLPFKQKLDVDSTAVRPYLVNYYAVERNQGFIYSADSYTWFQDVINYILPAGTG